MRVAILWASAKRASAGAETARSLVRGMEAMGHQVDLIDAWTGDGTRLPAYGYVAVIAEQTGLFGGVMPESLARTLGAGRGLVGKKGAAFLKKTGPFTGRALANLMRAMEREGMVVNWSDIILSASHAEALGKRIGT
ncbi:MAG: hypothetical protein LBC88_09310 [Spirochaetaceae bacterium]|jgi:hypothetical protein|nr:hypothetical protein [Spirochaetaceae bacterium]